MPEQIPYVSEPIRHKSLREDYDFEELEFYWKHLKQY